MAMQPKDILSIQYTNPDPPANFDTSGAAEIAYGRPNPGDGTDVIGGPFPSYDIRQEWKQVLAPDEDYETDLVGASGWMLDPSTSGADVPFDHPFGFDWEFMLALDPDYQGLLARGNQVPEEDADIFNRARELGIPLLEGHEGAPALLGVEIDGGIVPSSFSGNVAEGDRVALFGRWIVDCGHAVTVPVPNQDKPTFRSEIHPPLLMATARVVEGNLVLGTNYGPQVTRAIFTSRPYLASQHFTTDLDQIYTDAGSDDGVFVPHMVNEVAKVNDTFLGIPTESTMVEAHPKIKSYPFHGAYIAHFVVKPPQAGSGSGSAGPGHVHLGGGALVPQQRLVVSYQFTIRKGIGVELISNAAGQIDLLVSLSHAGYTSPPLPTRSDITYSKDDLAKLDPAGGSGYTKVEWAVGLWDATLNVIANPLSGGILALPVVEGILGRGIKTDTYDMGPVMGVNTLDVSHYATANASDIPQGQGIVVDDNQPFPFFGWMEVAWVGPEAVQ
jgi:hypothetical protein